MSEHFLKFSSGFEKNYELIQEGYRDDEIEYQSKSRMEIKIEKNKYNDFECKMKIIYGESNFCVNSFKTAFVTELYKKYNYYNLILNSENKIIKVKNKREIINDIKEDITKNILFSKLSSIIFISIWFILKRYEMF